MHGNGPQDRRLSHPHNPGMARGVVMDLEQSDSRGSQLRNIPFFVATSIRFLSCLQLLLVQ